MCPVLTLLNPGANDVYPRRGLDMVFHEDVNYSSDSSESSSGNNSAKFTEPSWVLEVSKNDSRRQPWKKSLAIVDKADHDKGEDRFHFGYDPAAPDEGRYRSGSAGSGGSLAA
ncbi:hypothetical protein N7462_008034 [Penicillium macrosclerotiorum]|uniref:uncharacterized protein n=1 Tax=Penicillium macrosclerotiorum TaxID=303699 RepID=UPI00254743D4|nr:uncharacterized protein N7462_008034 [Penicillium macrosclerotiorum]KAJ5679790.1 hypothetical protein N7462_008034 [Penicillium macrosclerotiorum]